MSAERMTKQNSSFAKATGNSTTFILISLGASPADSDLSQVIIISGDSFSCCGLSTICFCMSAIIIIDSTDTMPENDSHWLAIPYNYWETINLGSTLCGMESYHCFSFVVVLQMKEFDFGNFYFTYSVKFLKQNWRHFPCCHHHHIEKVILIGRLGKEVCCFL